MSVGSVKNKSGNRMLKGEDDITKIQATCGMLGHTGT
jgi:hypothetical protein